MNRPTAVAVWTVLLFDEKSLTSASWLKHDKDSSMIFYLKCTTLLIVMMLSGCCLFVRDKSYPKINYEGDGSFVDYGRCRAIGRFNLVLGSLDLTRNYTKIYRIKALPETNLTFRIHLDFPYPDSLYLPREDSEFHMPVWTDTVVALRLSDSRGSTVFEKKAPIKDWVWSGAFHGKTSELWTSETHFVPASEQEYFLSIEIQNAHLNSPAATLDATGGGWKMQPYFTSQQAN